jgi:hypothetical protein
VVHRLARSWPSDPDVCIQAYQQSPSSNAHPFIVSGSQQGSVFIRKVTNEAETPSTKVKIRYADASVEKDTCAAKVVWSSTAEIKDAFIHDEILMKGKTKVVHRVRFLITASA